MESKRKPDRYWQDWNNVEQELQDLIAKLGHFPTHDEIKLNVRSGLSAAIRDRYGGIAKVAEQLGYKSQRKDYGYYCEWNNVEKDLRSITNQLNRFPTARDLRRLGLTSLHNVIARRYGGFVHVAKRMGYDAIEVRKAGVWKDLEYTVTEAKKAMQKEGWTILPPSKTLEQKGYSGLSNAIHSYHGSMITFRRILNGQTPILSERDQLENLLSRYVEGKK